MAATAGLKLDSLTTAICRGVVEGNRELVAVLGEDRNKRHDLRGVVDGQGNKLHELDSEIKLLKGFIFTLMGNGDGSTGMVPRLERDVREMGESISTLATNVATVTVTVQNVADDVKAVLAEQKKLAAEQDTSKNFMAGWSGAKVALSIVISVMTAVIGILTFLLARGFHF